MAREREWLARLALGAVAGFAGTLVIDALRRANQKWLPETTPPIREDPGQFMVQSAEDALPEEARSRVPDWVEPVASQGLAIGYGLTFGAVYALLRPRGGARLLEGVALGLATWAAGYAGWLPALGLMPPPWRQKPAQVALPVAQHAAYGVATVAAYDFLARRLGASQPAPSPGRRGTGAARTLGLADLT